MKFFSKIQRLLNYTKLRFSKLQLFFGALLLLFFLLLGALWFYTVRLEFAREAKGAEIKKELEQQFREINPLPGATTASYNSTHGIGKSLVSSNYKVDVPYEEVRKHYHSELTRHGWKFRRVVNTVIRGQDVGWKRVVYCKGSYAAEIEYFGQRRAELGVDYVLGLSWGLSEDCN